MSFLSFISYNILQILITKLTAPNGLREPCTVLIKADVYCVLCCLCNTGLQQTFFLLTDLSEWAENQQHLLQMTVSTNFARLHKNLLSQSPNFPMLWILTKELWTEPHCLHQPWGTHLHRWMGKKPNINLEQSPTISVYSPLSSFSPKSISAQPGCQNYRFGQRRCKIWVSHWPVPVWPVISWCKQSSKAAAKIRMKKSCQC